MGWYNENHMEDAEKKKNFTAMEKLDLSEYKEGQYLIFVEGKIVKKGFAVDKLIKSVRKRYPEKTPFIYRVHPKGPAVL